MLRGVPKVTRKATIDRFNDSYAGGNLRFEDTEWRCPNDKPRKLVIKRKKKKCSDNLDELE